MADNIAVKDATGTTVTVISKDTGAGVQLPGHHIADPTTPSQKLAVDSNGRAGIGIVIPGTAATNLGKAEDAAHTSGDTGVMALAVRNDGGSALAGTDGDYIPLSTDSNGNLRVAATVTAGGGTQYTEDGASAGAESLMLAGAVRRDAAASSSGTDGDYSTLNTDATGQLWTHVGASALPSGAATSAKQPALGTAGSASADVLSVQGIASGTALGVSIADGSNTTFGAEADGAAAGDTTTATFMGLFKRLLQRITTLLAVFPTTIDTNSGTKSASTLRVVLATDQPALTNKLLVTPDANSAVNVAQVGGTNTVNGGLAGSQSVGGTVATNVAITDNPLNLGAQAVSSENSAVTTARKVQLVADLVGKLITLPYANPEQFENGTCAAITDTTSTALIAAGGAGVRHYVTSLTVTNSHATVGTFVKLLDGASIIWEGYCAAAGGGFCISFPVPLRGTANTALNLQPVTTGANVIGSVAGYKGA